MLLTERIANSRIRPPRTKEALIARRIAFGAVRRGSWVSSPSERAVSKPYNHGIRHLPVLEAGRRLVGVLDDVDLMANERRAPFRLRALIARSADAPAVAEAASELPNTVMALHDAGLPAGAVSRMIASIHGTTVRRLIDIAHETHGGPPVPYTWLATGSLGRREPFPSSDVDCALAWEGDDDPELREWMTHAGEADPRRPLGERDEARRQGCRRLESAVRPLDRGVGDGGPVVA